MPVSKFQDQIDSNDAICPYCEDSYHVESEDYDESEREETCENCGNKYWLYQSFSVDHCTRPDCELNGKSHEYELITLQNGKKVYFCLVCDKCKLFEA